MTIIAVCWCATLVAAFARTIYCDWRNPDERIGSGIQRNGGSY